MRICIWTAPLLLGLAVPAAAQSVDGVLFSRGAKARGGKTTELELVASTQKALAAGAPKATVRAVPLADGSTSDFALERFEVFTPDAQVIATDGATEKAISRPDVVTYRGKSLHDPSRSAYLAIAGGQEIYMLVGGGQKGNSLIAPAGGKNASATKHELSAGDADVLRDFACASDELPRNLEAKADFNEAAAQVKSNTPLEAELLIDVGYPLYQQLGSNLSTATNYAANLIATVSSIYTRDLNVQIKIKQLYVWTSTDPFSGGANSGAQINAYAAYDMANRSGVARDAAHLVTFRSGFGGLAFMSSLCDQSFAYGVSNAYGSTSYPIGGYFWDVNVVAHELGHNFGTDHTHCYSPPIDCCVAECVCGSAVLQQGTIMSYCHLDATIDLSFHSRCVTVMRAFAESQACITPPASEALVTGPGGLAIPNGDVTPSPADGTSFGAANVTLSESISRTFSIASVGPGSLGLTGTPSVTLTGADAASFSVASQPGSTSLSAGGSTSFQISFTPQQTGHHFATVVVPTSSGSWTFQISGFGAVPEAPLTASFAGAVAIPDHSATGVTVQIPVSGISGYVADVDFLIGGSTCTGTGVGISHTWVGDLMAKLTSPNGTPVILLSRPGAQNVASRGDDFCNTLLDEQGGGPSITTITDSGVPPLGPPYSGTFLPHESLSAFNGEDPNGIWTVYFVDMFEGDAGTVRNLSLIITPTQVAMPAAAADWSLLE